MSYRPVLVIDLETTGIFDRDPWAMPVEVGAVLVLPSGEVGARFERLMRPAEEPPPEADRALEINGITRAEIAAAAPMDEVLEAFADWRATLDDFVCSAFPVSFERAGLERVGVTLPWGACIRERAMPIMARAGALSRRYSGGSSDGARGGGGWRYPSLSAAAVFFGVPHDPARAHRALYDAELAGSVLVRVRDREQEEED